MLDEIFGEEPWQKRMERKIDTLANARLTMEEKLKKEQQARDISDTNIKKQIVELREETIQALGNIQQALARLNAPPSREEAPVLQQIQSDIAALNQRLTRVEDRLRR